MTTLSTSDSQTNAQANPRALLNDDTSSDILEHLQDELPVELISTSRSKFKTCHAREQIADVIARNIEEYDFFPVLKFGFNDKSAPIVGLLEVSAPASASARVEDVMSPLSEENLIGADASILDFLRDADRRPCRLIVAGPRITGLVSLSDIQRLPVRAALFAMITHLEMTMTDAIRRGNESADWMTKLPPGRKEKLAEEIERSTSGNSFVDALLLTQFSDKADILRKSEGFPSGKTTFKKQMNSVRDLRDQLAHANEFATTRLAAQGVCEIIRVIDYWIGELKRWPKNDSLK